MKPLPPDTVSLISTGQIIVSIYTAVKELVENALDSEATIIQVDLEDYGLEKISIRDNGKGVEGSDIPLMVKNHYTSKIIGFNDLESLQTFGFRGEALHAIMESSGQLEILSRSQNSSMGSLFVFDSKGNITKQCCQAVIPGTTVTVSQLFHKTPVRRERYKKNSSMKKSELKDIECLILGFSLIYPHKRFLLSSHKSVIFQRPVCKTFRDAVIGTLGKSVADKWTNVSLKDDFGVTIEMWIACNAQDPTLCRSSNDRSFIFVNDRPVEMAKISRLLKKYLCDSRKKSYPISLVKIYVPAKDVDANIEPSKKTVFFKQEDPILKLIENKLNELYSDEKGENPQPIFTDKIVEVGNHDIEIVKSKDNNINNEFQQDPLQSKISSPSESHSNPFSADDKSGFHNADVQGNAQIFLENGNASQKFEPLNEKNPNIDIIPVIKSKDPSLVSKEESNVNKTGKIVVDPFMSKDPESNDIPFQNNSFISSTLLDTSKNCNSFINSSKENIINSKMTSLYSWATGKTLDGTPPVGIVIPRPETNKMKRSVEFKKNFEPPYKKSRSLGDNSLLGLIKPRHYKETIKFRKKEIHANFDMENLSRMDISSQSKHDNDLSIIGKLFDSEIWIGILNNSIYALHPSRFNEINIYNRLIGNQTLTSAEMPYPSEIGDSERTEKLIKLRNDERLNRNGFKTSADGKYLTHSCCDIIPEVGLDDLFYILDIIDKNPKASLAECRSPNIIRFFQKECMKVLSDCPPGVNSREMYQLYSSSLKYFKNVAQETCFHRKKVILKLFDIK